MSDIDRLYRLADLYSDERLAMQEQEDLSSLMDSPTSRLSKTSNRASADSQTSNTSLSTYFTYAKDESDNITKYVKRHLERTYKEDVKTWTPAMVAEFG